MIGRPAAIDDRQTVMIWNGKVDAGPVAGQEIAHPRDRVQGLLRSSAPRLPIELVITPVCIKAVET
jgi:hypothetical protein